MRETLSCDDGALEMDVSYVEGGEYSLVIKIDEDRNVSYLNSGEPASISLPPTIRPHSGSKRRRSRGHLQVTHLAVAPCPWGGRFLGRPTIRPTIRYQTRPTIRLVIRATRSASFATRLRLLTSDGEVLMTACLTRPMSRPTIRLLKAVEDPGDLSHSGFVGEGV